MKYRIFIPAFTLTGLLFLVSCKEKAPEAVTEVFSLSDTMMNRCEFYQAKLQDVKNDIRLFGKITVDNNKAAQVYPVVSGNVLTIDAELGDYVKQGQKLATLRSSEVAEFQRQKLDAQSEVAMAEKNLQVAKDLFEGKLNSEKDVTAAEKELTKAKAELSRINEIYAIYKLKDGTIYTITAPISGFILSKNIYPNEQLRVDISDPLFSISQINEVWALANVSESDVSKIQLGYNAEVRTLGFPNSIYKGKIDKIFNTIDPETKAMKVRVKIPNENFQLKPEMMATVDVLFSENQEMVAVPSSSVIFDKSRSWVMVFKSRSDIETRSVEVYRQLNDITYISSGLSAGEKVISKNGLFVYDALND